MEKNLGHATAYGYAKSKGYSGTEDEFAQLMADYASVGQSAAQSAEQAAASATSASDSAATAASAAQTATSKASEAVTAAGTATTKASEASQSATSASQSAESAGTSAQTATMAASTATAKASEASESAATASTAKTDAETARDAAAQSASEAAASAESIDPDEFDRKIYAAFATDTATGAIASFPDGADSIPMKDVLVHIEPVQEGSGDPSPDNVRPITGWTGAKVTRCGKNMLNPNDPDYGNYTIEPDGATLSESTRIATGFIPCAEGVQLTFSTNKKTDGIGTNVQFAFAGLAAYDKDKNFLTRETVNNQRVVTITTPADTAYVRAFEQVTLGGTSATITPADFATYEQQLELGSTATDYEPYSGQTYDITFPSEAGTVYGGTLDVTKGELVVDRAIKTLSQNDSFTILSQGTLRSRITWNGYESVGKPDRSFVSNILKSMPASNGGFGTSDWEIWGSITAPRCWISAPLPYTIDDFKELLSSNPIEIVYYLATPIIYQLTPQEITSLFGVNNLWADTGDSEVEYRADTKLYITKKITEAVSALS